jgi:hypothetical protein
MSHRLFNHFLLRLWPDGDYFQVRLHEHQLTMMNENALYFRQNG